MTYMHITHLVPCCVVDSSRRPTTSANGAATPSLAGASSGPAPSSAVALATTGPVSNSLVATESWRRRRRSTQRCHVSFSELFNQHGLPAPDEPHHLHDEIGEMVRFHSLDANGTIVMNVGSTTNATAINVTDDERSDDDNDSDQRALLEIHRAVLGASTESLLVHRVLAMAENGVF